MYEDNKLIGRNVDIFLFCLTGMGIPSFSERKKIINILTNFEKNFTNLRNATLSYGVENDKSLLLIFNNNEDTVISFHIKDVNSFTIKIKQEYIQTLFLHSMFYIYGNNDVVDVLSKKKKLEEINFDINYIDSFMENIAGICNIRDKSSEEKLNHRYNLILNNIENLNLKEFYFSNKNKGNLEDEKSASKNSISDIHSI